MARPGLKSEMQGEPFAKGVVGDWTAGAGHWKDEDATATQAGWRAMTKPDVVLVQVLYDKAYKGKYLQEVIVPPGVWGTGDSVWWWKNDAHEYETGASADKPPEVNQQDVKTEGTATEATRIALYNQAHEGVAWPA